MTKKNPHWGTTLDTFLSEDGIREAAKTEAVTRVVAWGSFLDDVDADVRVEHVANHQNGSRSSASGC